MAAKKAAAVTPERVRAFWAMRQGMGGAMSGASAHDVLARTGWARSVGGSNPYLVVRDRAGLGRAEVDRAAAALEVHELPSARGCTYVVPQADFAIALRASQGHGDDAEIAAAKKYLGVTDKELDRLERKVVDALAKAPLDPGAIKEAAGDAVRSLGPEGKKRGIGTTLPLVLGRLQTRGEIRRVPVDGRLDQQRYRYARWAKSPLAGKTIGDAEIALELARRFFAWTGPATVAQLAWWSGLGVKAAKGAAAEVGAVPLDDAGDRLLLKADRDELLATDVPKEPRVAFVSSLDNLVAMRRDVAAHLADEDAGRALVGAANGKKAGSSLKDLEYHPICDRGRVIGLWDWDGVKGELVWRTFAKAPRGAREAAEALATYVTKELGDARSFSLDSPGSRSERVEALRKVKW